MNKKSPVRKGTKVQVTKVKAQRRPRIGFHAPIKGGLHNALIVARDTGCDTVQLFSRNPRAWLAKPTSIVWWLRVLTAVRRGGGPLVVHDCATRPWVRRLLGWRARRAGLPLHLILLDVPGDVARSGQWARGRVVRSGSMATHCQRWPELVARAAEDPGYVVPGALSAHVLTRAQANGLERISFS